MANIGYIEMDETWWRSAHELDDDQRALIEIPTDEGHYLVTGPPGCGKTNVLLLRAIYLRSSGLANGIVLVFTRALREFISAGSNPSTMIPSGQIDTHAGWTLDLLRKLGRPLEYTRLGLSHDEAREERCEALESAVSELSLRSDYYDAVFLDEVQDYWAREVTVLAGLTRRLFVVGDAGQRIYARNEGIQAAVDIGCEERVLRYHYRMGRKICRAADRLLSTQGTDRLEAYCQYDEHELPSRVSAHSMTDINSQLRLLERNLYLQLRAYPEGWLGVFTVLRETRDRIAEYLSQTGLASNLIIQADDGDSRTFDPVRRVVVSTLHSAKGTEYRCVHFVAADGFPYFTREKAFTGITRAKTTLDVYHSGHMEGALESALSEPRVPDLSGILG